MSSGFNGFTQQALIFLQEIAIHNSQEWFEEHRPVYERELLTPFRHLVDALSQTALIIDPYFETRPTIGKTLSRIHRDTRFSHDKSRYRSRMWLAFRRHTKQKSDAPCYFFGLSPDSYTIGLGYYNASRSTMDLFRQTIRNNPQRFLAAVACYQPPFELVGESYKRPLIKDQSPEIADWYNRKTIALMSRSYQLENTFTAKLVDEITDGFIKMQDLYHYLLRVESMKVEAIQVAVG